MMVTAFGPYRLKMRAASMGLAPCAWRKIITSRIARCSCHARDERVGARASEAVHLAQAMRLFVEDLQRVEPELLDDALRGDLADALDEARAEVLLDAGERRRRELGHARRAQLLAVVLVDLDRPARPDARADADLRKEPTIASAIAAPGHVDLDDAEAGLAVSYVTTVDLAFDRDLPRTPCAGCTGSEPTREPYIFSERPTRGASSVMPIRAAIASVFTFSLIIRGRRGAASTREYAAMYTWTDALAGIVIALVPSSDAALGVTGQRRGAVIDDDP